MSNLIPTQNLRQDPEAGKIKDILPKPIEGGESSISIAITTTRTAWLASLPSVRGAW